MTFDVITGNFQYRDVSSKDNIPFESEKIYRQEYDVSAKEARASVNEAISKCRHYTDEEYHIETHFGEEKNNSHMAAIRDKIQKAIELNELNGKVFIVAALYGHLGDIEGLLGNYEVSANAYKNALLHMRANLFATNFELSMYQMFWLSRLAVVNHLGGNKNSCELYFNELNTLCDGYNDSAGKTVQKNPYDTAGKAAKRLMEMTKETLTIAEKALGM